MTLEYRVFSGRFFVAKNKGASF